MACTFAHKVLPEKRLGDHPTARKKCAPKREKPPSTAAHRTESSQPLSSLAGGRSGSQHLCFMRTNREKFALATNAQFVLMRKDVHSNFTLHGSKSL
jgi:hypothetical protein